MSRTIYETKIWPMVLEKYQDLKEVAFELGLENDPNTAYEIRQYYDVNFGDDILSRRERRFAVCLKSVEFAEQVCVDELLKSVHEARKLGDFCNADIIEKMVRGFFDSDYRFLLMNCQKRNLDVSIVPFSEMYELFFEVNQLRSEYKVTFTTFFIMQFLEMKFLEYGEDPREVFTEIEKYFKENDEVKHEFFKDFKSYFY